MFLWAVVEQRQSSYVNNVAHFVSRNLAIVFCVNYKHADRSYAYVACLWVKYSDLVMLEVCIRHKRVCPKYSRRIMTVQNGLKQKLACSHSEAHRCVGVASTLCASFDPWTRQYMRCCLYPNCVLLSVVIYLLAQASVFIGDTREL